MINENYFNTIPVPKNNILHDYKEHNLTDLSNNTYSENEINNLIINSNLDNLNIIK